MSRRAITATAATVLAAVFDVTASGNFEHGRSVLWQKEPLATVAKLRNSAWMARGVSGTVSVARAAAAERLGGADQLLKLLKPLLAPLPMLLNLLLE